MMKTTALTGVGTVISAAHMSRDGIMHGHTWEITAWFEEGRCALVLQEELKNYLKMFDHLVLGDDVAWGEALGRAIIHGMGCVKVEVSRPLERIYAVVEIAK